MYIQSNWIRNKLEEDPEFKERYTKYRIEYRKRYYPKIKDRLNQKARETRKWEHHPRGNTRKEIWAELVKRDGEYCKICKTIIDLTIQHKIPVIVGGKENIENLEILCRKCNATEYHKLVRIALEYYFKSQN